MMKTEGFLSDMDFVHPLISAVVPIVTLTALALQSSLQPQSQPQQQQVNNNMDMLDQGKLLTSFS